MNSNRAPIVVDLDHTLIKTDMLFESFFRFIKGNPLNLVRALAQLISAGKAGLKSIIADHVDIDAETLPFNQDVIDWLRQKKEHGHPLILATASHQKYANAIADHLQMFDQVLATQGDTNLKAGNKEKKLVELFGHKEFIYVGDSRADLDVWRSAKSAVLVAPPASLLQQAQSITEVEKVFSATKDKWVFVKAIRAHQWVKNLLVFVPLLTSHNLTNPGLLISATGAFIAFCLCASSAYILNDLLDLQDDRRHAGKRSRVFATGDLDIGSGILIMLCCLAGSAILGLLLPRAFLLVLALYFALTIAYSFFFKHKMMLDIVVLAGLYTTRIIAGAAAISVDLSFWLLALSMFMFLNLASIKRYIELLGLQRTDRPTATTARDYQVGDINILSSLGIASGYISVLVMALYVNSNAVTELYRQPNILWAICPILLYWVGRIWLLAHRGRVADDPIQFVIKDKVSWLTAIVCAVIFWLAA